MLAPDYDIFVCAEVEAVGYPESLTAFKRAETPRSTYMVFPISLDVAASSKGTR